MRLRPNNLLRSIVLLLLLQGFILPCIAQLPTANFTANTTSGCAPLTVYFTDLSTGSPFSWNWDFGNGQLAASQNPGVTFSQPGVYTVRLVVKNAAGIDDEIKTNYITVSPSPNAAFTSNLTTACVPGTIFFTDQSTSTPGSGSIVSWLWDFGDGNTSTLQNPSHTFTAIGFYTISLRVTSSTGCQNTASIGRYIRIVGGVDVNFNWSQPGTCQPPFIINFQDQSSGPGTLNYSWNFGNGGPGSNLPNPSATYSSAGTYSVTLNVQSNLGCSGSLTKSISITGKTTDFIPPSSICIGQNVSFQNNSSPAPVSSFWDFGDGTTSSQINPSKTYLSGGTFPVRLINNYGNCSDSITKNVTVITQPAVNFTANDTTACRAPFSVQFSDASPSASTWLWDFGDGTTSNQQNPLHTYTVSGNFNVTLTITLSGGCTNTITKNQFIKISSTTVNILNAPNGGCIPFIYSPFPQVQSVDSIVSYVWNMGEPGATYNTKFPTHVYTSAGNFTISLTVTTQTGCTETVTIPDGIRTGIRPIVNFSFTPNNVCANTPIQFTDLSVTTPGALLKWEWDFGDGTTSLQQNPSHIYRDTGTLRTTLIVTNNGCRDSASKSVTILPPVAIFGYSANCNNRLQVTFLDSSLVNPIFGPVTYEWRMGDPANTIFFGSTPPTFTYPAFGTYTATLIVTNGSCSYQTTKNVILINEVPNFSVNKNPVCKSEVFTLNAVVNAANIVDYTWTIGTTTIPDTTSTIDFSLPAYGNYNVTLMVEDLNGCFNSRTIPNFMQVRGPVANFLPNGRGGCVNSSVSFSDLSTPPGAVVQWTWNFGDGVQQTYTSPPFSHTYTETGSYSVSLMISDGGICADTLTLPNSVLITRPVANFRADTVYCPLAPLQFVDTSSGNGLSYVWQFGDGGTSTLKNPTHSYPNGDNIYSVKLIITDTVGCKDSLTKLNYITIQSPRSKFTMQDSTGICQPTVTTFTFEGQNYQSYYWDFGDGSQSTTLNPAHFYNSYGTFKPKLFLVGPGGCIDSAMGTVIIYNPYTTTQITSNPSSACNSLTTNFTVTKPPGFKFKFYFGDGAVDSSQQLNLTHTYSTPGNYTAFVIIVDNYGCDAGISAWPVIVYGALPIFSMNKKEFCDGGEVFFNNYTLNNEPIVSTVWDFADGNSSTDINPSHVFAAPGTYVVKLTVTTQNLCTQSALDTVRIYPMPILSITGKDTICVNRGETFGGVLAQPDSTIAWQWSFGNGTTSQIQNPLVTYANTGNYDIHLVVKNKLDCADTSDFRVNVTPLPTVNAVTDPIKIISGASGQLNMNYTGPISSYLWSPAQSLDCGTCPSPIANPQFTTKYNVKITDRYGCKNEGFITVQVVCNGQNFFIPNTFSPNGDGVNDVFYLRGSGLFRVKTLRVFSRWGEVVFEKTEFPVNDALAGWNGTYKGKKAKPDVYVYQLEIICSNGDLINYSGNVALIQ